MAETNIAIDSRARALAEYVAGVFTQFKQDRAPVQTRWQQSINDFRSMWDLAKKGRAGEGEDWRSRTGISLMREKCLAAYAMIVDIMLQGKQEVPFLLRPVAQDEAAYGRILQGVAPVPVQPNDVDQRAEAMRSLILEQLAACNADRVLMAHIIIAAIYGETIGKTVTGEYTRKAWEPVEDTLVNGQAGPSARYSEVQYSRTVPQWVCRSVWDVFRDLETDDLQAGRAVIDRAWLSPYELRQRLGKDGYLDTEIKALLDDQGAGAVGTQQPGLDADPGRRELTARKSTLQYLEYWGRVPRKLAEAVSSWQQTGAETAGSDDTYKTDDGDEVEVLAGVVGERLVRFMLRPPSRRPFCRAVWESGVDEPGGTGIGLGDRMKDVQHAFNWAIRSYEDNKKLAGNVLLGMKRELLVNPPTELRPGLVLQITEECADVRQALMPVTIPDVTAGIEAMIGLYMTLADMESHVPRTAQGQANDSSTPRTAYEIGQLLDRSTKYMGVVVRNFDEGLIEPQISAFLAYNLADPALAGMQGAFEVRPQGFTAFQDRVLRTRTLEEYLTLVFNMQAQAMLKLPAALRRLAQARDIDPDEVLKTDEEMAADAEAAAQAQQLEVQKLQAEVAKIQAETEKVKIEAQLELERLRLEKARLVADVRGTVAKERENEARKQSSTKPAPAP
jgi:hypothetical protein